MASSVQADDNCLSLQLISWKLPAGRQPHDGYVLGGRVQQSAGDYKPPPPQHTHSAAGSVQLRARALLPTRSTPS